MTTYVKWSGLGCNLKRVYRLHIYPEGSMTRTRCGLKIPTHAVKADWVDHVTSPVCIRCNSLEHDSRYFQSQEQSRG